MTIQTYITGRKSCIFEVFWPLESLSGGRRGVKSGKNRKKQVDLKVTAKYPSFTSDKRNIDLASLDEVTVGFLDVVVLKHCQNT